MVLAEGEFAVSYGDDQIEVWVTQMGSWANMNTAFIDRTHGIVAIVRRERESSLQLALIARLVVHQKIF